MLPINHLFENIPEHPDTTVIKNEFYPDGLTQKQIYQYYISQKKTILKNTDNREVMIFFNVGLNKFIIKRKASKDELIKLTSENYDTIISGRTVSIHSTMNQQENFGIIDLDFNDFETVKNATIEVYDYLFKSNKNLEIRFTGKTGFHIIYYNTKKFDINYIKKYLNTMLTDSDLFPKYNINISRSTQKVNIDLSSNKFRGGFITPNALSILGLKCMTISRKQLEKFNRKEAKI